MEQDNGSKSKLTSSRKTGLLIGSVLTLAVLVLAVWIGGRQKPTPLISLSETAAAIQAGQVTRIEDALGSGEFTIYFADESVKKGLRDGSASLLEQLSYLGLDEAALRSVEFEVVKHTGLLGDNPANVVLVMALMAAPVAIVYRLTRGDRMGKKTFQEAAVPDLRFKDVAGLDENVQELRDVVTFLKQGEKYAEVGAKMPRGVLMVGDPGTGKTLIAKAVAGEAGVPFFATSGSEFTEVFVGVGASRIRSLFQKARKKAPCIIFIDEIDAVGRERHRSESGAEMEQDQTLNQLLVEMDGFGPSEGVVVLAATNRLDVLDSALTRAGRFDRRVYIGRPDVRGREAILKIHVKGKKLAEQVDLGKVAKATPGLVGADLANVVNEAAISAVRNDHPAIEMGDFDEAVEKMIAGGVPRKNYVMSEAERRIVAYHEAGHALVMHATKLADPVYKITIIPRGQAGGYTMAVPDEDRMLMSRCNLLARITGLLGGRAAEEIFFKDVTSGASNDLKVATQLAEEMVMRLGMDRSTGLRVFPEMQGRVMLGLPGSQKTFEGIDEAVNKILEDCYADALNILNEQSDTLERIANKLLEVETLEREAFLALIQEGSLVVQ